MTLSNLPEGVTNEMIDGEGFFCVDCDEQVDEFDLDEDGRCPECASAVAEEYDAEDIF